MLPNCLKHSHAKVLRLLRQRDCETLVQHSNEALGAIIVIPVIT